MYCERHVPFYRLRFCESGFNLARLDDLSRVEAPSFLTKQDIREQHNGLYAMSVSRRFVRRNRTGGPTGEHAQVYMSWEDAWF